MVTGVSRVQEWEVIAATPVGEIFIIHVGLNCVDAAGKQNRVS